MCSKLVKTSNNKFKAGLLKLLATRDVFYNKIISLYNHNHHHHDRRFHHQEHFMVLINHVSYINVDIVYACLLFVDINSFIIKTKL